MFETSTCQLMHSPIIELSPILAGEQIHGNYTPTIGMPYMMSPPFVPHFATKASAQLEISSFI
jgi:hypothetical protein